MRTIERGGYFSEQIAISCSELARFQLPETLDFHLDCIVHDSVFLSEVFTPESMNALFRRQKQAHPSGSQNGSAMGIFS
jgi:hypothetical protein